MDFSFYLKNLQIYKELQMDRRIFWFWCYWENLQIYKKLRYIYNQLPVTPSIGGEKSYSVLQMDRWIFDDIWKIYKSTRNCQWIGGFLGLDAIGKIYKSTRNRAIHIVSSYQQLLWEGRISTVFCKWIGGFLMIFEKSTNLQGIANG